MKTFTLYVCENYYREYEYVMVKNHLDCVHLEAYACGCLNQDTIRQIQERFEENVYVLAPKSAQGKIEGDPGIHWILIETCAASLIPDTMIAFFENNRMLLVSSAVLDRWKHTGLAFGYSQKTDILSFFQAKYDHLVLITLEEAPEARETLVAFSEYLGAKHSVLQVEEDYILGKIQEIMGDNQPEIEMEMQDLTGQIESLQKHLSDTRLINRLGKEIYNLEEAAIYNRIEAVLQSYMNADQVTYFSDYDSIPKHQSSYITSNGRDIIIPCLIDEDFFGVWCVQGFKIQGDVKRFLEMGNNIGLLFSLSMTRKDLIKAIELGHIQELHHNKLASIGQMAAGLAHEINNPLSFVTSNMMTFRSYYKSLSQLIIPILSDSNYVKKLMKEGILSQKEVDEIDYVLSDTDMLFEDVEEGLTRIATIIKRFRGFTNVGQDGISYNIDLNKLLKDIVYLFRSHFVQVSTVDLKLSNIPFIEGSTSELNLIIYDIMINAIEAIQLSPNNKKGCITIQTEQVKDCVRLAISDNGIGLDPNHQYRVFDPFFTTKEVGNGVGLGLTYAYDVIVKHHKGRIALETKDHITTCIIELPLTWS